MPNLMDAVTTKTELSTSRIKSVRTCLTKKEVAISASAEAIRKSERFYFVRVPTRKLPLLSVEATSDNGAIVVDTNSRRKKATSSGFVPKVIVLKGLKNLQAAKAEEKTFVNVWVGERALRKLNISAEDSIGSNALSSKLQRCISEKYKNQKSQKSSDNVSYSPSPWIEEVFPYDKYFVFRYDGEMYRANFTLDKKTQEPSLSGEPVKAVVSYQPIAAASLADMIYDQSPVDRTMSQEMMFDKINNSSPAIGSIAYEAPIVPDGTYYPAGSELARPELRTMLNVREALEIFLAALKDGTKGPLKIMFSPVVVPTDKFFINASREAEIAAREARVKINLSDFIFWQHHTLSKRGVPLKDGLTANAYAYVGDPRDISTWFLRIKDCRKGKIEKLVMRCSGIPEKKKSSVVKRLKEIVNE